MTAMLRRFVLIATQRKDLYAKEKIGVFILIFQPPGEKRTRFVIWMKMRIVIIVFPKVKAA